MRVLHVIPAVAPRYGGPSCAVVSMCRAIARLGVDTLIVTTDADGRRRLPVAIETPTDWQDVPALFFERAFSESFKYSARLGGWLRAHVTEFDVVHIHAVLSHAPLAAAAAARRAGVPYIVRPLGTLASWSLGRNRYRKKLLLGLGAARLLRDAAAVHYTSIREQSDVEATLGLSRGVVIPLGIEPEYLASPPVPVQDRADERYVLALTRLHPKKNLEALIDSFVASQKGSPWRLIIAGDGERRYVRSLEKLVADRHAESSVTFTGWVEGAAKLELIRRASIFAMPSLHENFGVSLLEALAAGVPALVSREVHLADDVEAGRAGWVTATDRSSLTRALDAALDEHADREDRGRAASVLAQRFSWPKVAARIVELYQHVEAPLPRSSATFRPDRVEARIARR
jgi:glycosyltransferase involved in cell wall biosynthesis